MFKLLILIVIFCLLPYMPLSGCGDVYEQNVGFSTHRWAEQKSNLQYYNQTLHYRYNRAANNFTPLFVFFKLSGKKMFPTCSLEGSIAWPRWIKKKKHEEENQRVCIFLLHLVYTVRYFPFSRFVLRAVFIIATLYACVSHSLPHFGPASLKKTLNVMLNQFKQHRYNIFPSEINITLTLRTRWDEISFCKKHLQ